MSRTPAVIHTRVDAHSERGGAIELFIIRHAESGNNALSDNRDRVADPPITDLGRRQAEIVARHLARGDTHDFVPAAAPGATRAQQRRGFGITSLYSSPMLRSLQTAQPIVTALGLVPQVWVDIHERGGLFLDHGNDGRSAGHPGMTRSEILAQFPGYALPLEITERGWWNREREDPPTAGGRAIKVAQQLLNMAQSEDRVAIISHGAFIDILLKALLNQLPGVHTYYRHHNTAISRLSISEDGRTEIRSLNRVDHLPADLVS